MSLFTDKNGTLTRVDMSPLAPVDWTVRHGDDEMNNVSAGDGRLMATTSGWGSSTTDAATISVDPWPRFPSVFDPPFFVQPYYVPIWPPASLSVGEGCPCCGEQWKRRKGDKAKVPKRRKAGA